MAAADWIHRENQPLHHRLLHCQPSATARPDDTTLCREQVSAQMTHCVMTHLYQLVHATLSNANRLRQMVLKTTFETSQAYKNPLTEQAEHHGRP